jgi:hypothetical protein
MGVFFCWFDLVDIAGNLKERCEWGREGGRRRGAGSLGMDGRGGWSCLESWWVAGCSRSESRSAREAAA